MPKSTYRKVYRTKEFVPKHIYQGLLCMICHTPLQLILSTLADVTVGMMGKVEEGLSTYVLNGNVTLVGTLRIVGFPKKKRGRVCSNCYHKLYYTRWEDKDGNIHKAIDPVYEPGDG